jgi:EAL domain-containing protein (putative c-di-GMP-specific phosphodiesterase class I)
MESVEERCRRAEVNPDQMILELTETSAMEDTVLSLDLLTRLRLKGFQLSIDDFGTGYSSMLQLVRLPFTEIKVDKSFVSNAMTNAEHRTVIKSIVNLGHSLGLHCTAEGLEDAETLAYLNEVGCDLVQGYFIARPMDGASARGRVVEAIMSDLRGEMPRPKPVKTPEPDSN